MFCDNDISNYFYIIIYQKASWSGCTKLGWVGPDQFIALNQRFPNRGPWEIEGGPQHNMKI